MLKNINRILVSQQFSSSLVVDSPLDKPLLVCCSSSSSSEVIQTVHGYSTLQSLLIVLAMEAQEQTRSAVLRITRTTCYHIIATNSAENIVDSVCIMRDSLAMQAPGHHTWINNARKHYEITSRLSWLWLRHWYNRGGIAGATAAALVVLRDALTARSLDLRDELSDDALQILSSWCFAVMMRCGKAEALLALAVPSDINQDLANLGVLVGGICDSRMLVIPQTVATESVSVQKVLSAASVLSALTTGTPRVVCSTYGIHFCTGQPDDCPTHDDVACNCPRLCMLESSCLPLSSSNGLVQKILLPRSVLQNISSERETLIFETPTTVYANMIIASSDNTNQAAVLCAAGVLTKRAEIVVQTIYTKSSFNVLQLRKATDGLRANRIDALTVAICFLRGELKSSSAPETMYEKIREWDAETLFWQLATMSRNLIRVELCRGDQVTITAIASALLRVCQLGKRIRRRTDFFTMVKTFSDQIPASIGAELVKAMQNC